MKSPEPCVYKALTINIPYFVKLSRQLITVDLQHLAYDRFNILTLTHRIKMQGRSTFLF